MAKDQINPFHARPVGGRLPEQDELGRAASLDAGRLLAALRLVKLGEVYDLDTGRWPGMPLLFGSAPPFQVVTYHSPAGLRAQGVFTDYVGTAARFGWIDELVMGSMHSGTHVDGLSHVTIGENDRWYGKHTAADHLGDCGPLRADSTAIPPIITRGVLVDIARYLGLDPLPARHAITVSELQGALEKQQTQVEPGDTVLVRTGFMRVWETPQQEDCFGAGLSLEAGCWLADQGAVAIGVDNENIEVTPSADPEILNPLHVELLIERGIHTIETLFLEELASDQHHEFLFLCLTPKIKGTSGAIARPIAIV